MRNIPGKGMSSIDSCAVAELQDLLRRLLAQKDYRRIKVERAHDVAVDSCVVLKVKINVEFLAEQDSELTPAWLR